MPDLKVTFTLDEKDVSHLRRIMRKASSASKSIGEEAIAKEISAMSLTAREAKPPRYVLDAVDKLETVVAMTQDKEWALPSSVKKKVLAALTYFANPVDLIPDKVPGLGYLDDAIMIELVARDLRFEMKAYRDFVKFRDTAEQRPWTPAGKTSLEKRLVSKRRQLRAWIQGKEAKERDREGQKGSRRGLRIW